jgi:NAD(P)-dependent dehydrogenase (short-subunit alcohol dehydrogenase family)
MQIPQHSLADRVALVTGAGSGLGKASAKALAYAGASVALIGDRIQPVEETAAEIHHHGGRALALEADISKGADMQAAIQKMIDAWGRLDIVFANAGINGVWAPIEELSEEDWDRTLAINLKGTFLTLKYAFPHLKKQGGSVIVTASVNGTRMFSNTGATAYSCSKAGQVALTKMLALEWAKHKVRINVICPGAIETNINDSTVKRGLREAQIPVEFPEGMVPLTEGAPGTSGEVAQLVWFLASDAAGHITGTEVYIDGGQSLLQG